MTAVRVVLVDDHPMFRHGLRALVEDEPGLEVVGEAGDGDAAIALADAHRPDVVVMDIRMEGRTGIDAARAIRDRSPTVRALMLTMNDDDESVFAAMRAGASGYLLKGAHPDDFLRAVRGVAAGEAVFGPGIAHRMLDWFRSAHGPARTPFEDLTERENEILELIAGGANNHEIARRLQISQKTARNHVSNVLTKLQVTDRAQAIVKARDAGMGRGA